MAHLDSLAFSDNAARARADANLQAALAKLQRDTRASRPGVVGRLPEFEALRAAQAAAVGTTAAEAAVGAARDRATARFDARDATHTRTRTLRTWILVALKAATRETKEDARRADIFKEMRGVQI